MIRKVKYHEISTKYFSNRAGVFYGKPCILITGFFYGFHFLHVMVFNETNDKESVAIEEQVGFDKQDE